MSSPVVTPFDVIPRCRIVNEDSFGPERHYAVAWPDESGNWHYGWVPAAFVVQLKGSEAQNLAGVKVIGIMANVERPDGLLL